MTTSGSDNFNQTTSEIITDALVGLGVYRPGGTVSTNDLNYCKNILNKMIKGWESQGIHLWTQEEGALFLTSGKSKYTLSSTTTDVLGKDPIQTNLSANGSGTTLTVTSTSGMTAADNIGIALDDNTIQWTTIVSVDSSTQLTITASLTSSATSGNAVFTYTSAVGRPIYIKAARLQEKSGLERPIDVMGHEDFMDFAVKQVSGTVTAIHYNPKVSEGLLYVYQVPSDVNQCIRFTYSRSIQDFDNNSDNPDLPQEWLYTITTNLQVRVAGAYGINLQRENPFLITDAANSLLQLQLFDFEEGSVRVVPKERYDD